MNVNIGKQLIVAKSQLPIELYNALVTARGNFVNGCEALWRRVLELESEWNSDISTLFKQSQKILVKDGLDILCDSQGILRSLTSVDAWKFHVTTYFLKPYLKLASVLVVVRLLKGKPCPQLQEVAQPQADRSRRSTWQMEADRSEMKSSATKTWHLLRYTSKSFLHAPQPISSEISQWDINPSLLMRNKLSSSLSASHNNQSPVEYSHTSFAELWWSLSSWR